MAGSLKPSNFLVVLKIVVVIVCQVHNSEAYPGGAPIQACSHMTPQHNPSSPQTSSSPYTMSISHASYTPGQQMTVTISKDNASAALKGILIQARRETSSERDPVIGTWSHGDATNFEYLACEGANSAITHANNYDKSATISFNWTPPETNGAVYFMATFVQSKSVFWVAERTSIIERIDPCDNNSCLNGATCNPVNGSTNNYTCLCPNGFTGEYCQTENQCSSGNVCGDYGICSVVTGGVRCTCTDGYSGTLCIIPPGSDPCNPNPCLSGGNCTSNGSKFTCTCPDISTGSTCEITLIPCDSDPCLNEGTCTNSADNTTFMCDCPSDYTGTTCETVTISKDSASAALKGILIQARRETSSDGDQIIGTWSHGDATNFKYLACEGANSAITHANNNDKAAAIEFNWTPPETNGAVYFTATFVQLRSVFWVAERTNSIERDPASDPCNPNPCLSGGDCNQNGNMFTCNCPELTTGSTCEMTLNPCDSNPCLNGGNCTNSADNATFMCNCPFNYTGATCQPDLPSTTESISGTVLLTDRSSTTGKGMQLLCSLHLMMTAVMVLIAFL